MRLPIIVAMALLFAALFAAPAAAQFRKGAPAPCIEARDIHEQEVDTCGIIAERKPYLALYFFFDPDSGEDLALKLRLLDMRYGREKMEIVALGFAEDAEALRAFASRLDLRYHIIPKESLADVSWLEAVQTLPLVLFVSGDDKPVVEQVLSGGGQSNATFLKEVAENLYQKRRTEALEVADVALEEGEPESEVRELRGYILVSAGKLEAAQGEFTEIEDIAGLARVALERGDYAGAASIAEQAPDDGYAQSVRGQALMNQGKVDEAAPVLEEAAALPAREWQQSETATAQGRIEQERGNADGAISQFERAIALDPYNVVALSNESVVLQEQGKPEEALATLQHAASRRDDELVQLLLSQYQQQTSSQRLERIQQQIKDLAAWAERAEGQPSDTWTSRPLVVSFLAGGGGGRVFFPRAGTDSAVRFAIASELRERANVAVVDRDNIDLVLQEQQLSVLADPQTALQPGRLKIARYLSFVDFDQLGEDPFVFLRVTDTETGEIVLHHKESLPPGKVMGPVAGIVERLIRFYADQEVRGLIADVMEGGALLLNLAGPHGIQAGARFTVVEEGEPVTAGGQVIAYRQRPVAQITVTGFDGDTGLALAEVNQVREGTQLVPDMKIRSAE